MKEPRLKIEIEINVVGDGRTFLNFWNHENGDDVISELKDGKLYIETDEVEKEISLQEFIDAIKSKF